MEKVGEAWRAPEAAARPKRRILHLGVRGDPAIQMCKTQKTLAATLPEAKATLAPLPTERPSSTSSTM